MGYKRKRSKATDITMKTKETVFERDRGGCVYCGRRGYGVMPNAHFIPRSRGGLGVEENVVTLCQACHRNFDFGGRDLREHYRDYIRMYLQSKYSNWNEKDLIYKKREEL